MLTRNAISSGSGALKLNSHTIPLHNPITHFSFFKFISQLLRGYILRRRKPTTEQKAIPLCHLLLFAFCSLKYNHIQNYTPENNRGKIKEDRHEIGLLCLLRLCIFLPRRGRFARGGLSFAQACAAHHFVL